MIFLRLSKVILLGFTALYFASCTSTKQVAVAPPELKPYLASQNDGLVYDASFSYKDFNVSGLLVLMREQEGTYRVALLSKFGVSMMELQVNKNEVRWIKQFREIDNRSVVKMIERDFRMLILSDLDHNSSSKLLKETDSLQVYRVEGAARSHVWLDKSKNKVIYTENRGFLNPVKTKINFAYTSGQAFPDQVMLKHRNVDMSLKMDLLKVNYAER